VAVRHALCVYDVGGEFAHLERECLMKQVAIIPRDDIARELSDCIACLENSGIHVYATHRGLGYAVLWTEDPRDFEQCASTEECRL
jgi:hypothetical protein